MCLLESQELFSFLQSLDFQEFGFYQNRYANRVLLALGRNAVINSQLFINYPKKLQRATSTGLLCTFANLGGLLPAIVGPIIVTDPNSKFAQEFNSENKDYKTEIAKYVVICKYPSLKTIFENISILYIHHPTIKH